MKLPLGTVGLVGMVGLGPRVTLAADVRNGDGEDMLARQCQAAVINASEYAPGRIPPSDSQVATCVRYFGHHASEAELEALACQAASASLEAWRSCFGEAGDPPAPADGAMKVEIAAGQSASGGHRIPGVGRMSSSSRSGPRVLMGGDPVILGALDKSLVHAVIKRNMNQIRYCYLRELSTHPDISGKLVVEFVVGEDGSVSSATNKASSLDNPAVEGCIAGRFMGFSFPQPAGGGSVVVSYPFVFEPGAPDQGEGGATGDSPRPDRE